MKVTLDGDIVDHITLQGLKGLKKTFKQAKKLSYTTIVPIWDDNNRDKEYCLNRLMEDAIKLVMSNYEIGTDTEKLFYNLAIHLEELKEIYK
jgi:hypothetical protein